MNEEEKNQITKEKKKTQKEVLYFDICVYNMCVYIYIYIYHKFDDVQGRVSGFESFDADVEAVLEGLLSRKAALRRQSQRDVAGAAVECYGPPHHSLSLSLTSHALSPSSECTWNLEAPGLEE